MTEQSFKVQAEVLIAGLHAGYRQTRDAVAWADGVIAAESDPHISFIDLALAGSKSAAEISDLLRQVPGAVDRSEIAKAILKDMSAVVQNHSELAPRVARYLSMMSTWGLLPEEEYGFEPRIFPEYFDPNEPGAPTFQDAVADLETYLRKHVS